jgi:hypothetical protein
MSNLWRCLEVLTDGNYVAAEWANQAGEHFSTLRSVFLRDTGRRASFVPCPQSCGCQHEIIDRAGAGLVAICRCEPWNCEDFSIGKQETVLLTLNTAKLGRAVCKAFECDARETQLAIPRTWQIGTKFPNSVPVVFTLQGDREAFRYALLALAARLREKFIVLAPTSRFMDATCSETLAIAKAGFFDLESNLLVSTGGSLSSKTSPGKLFQSFAPDAEPDLGCLATQIFGMVENLEKNKRVKPPSVMQVFQQYCGRGWTAQKIADIYRCSKATVLNRLNDIRQATGKEPDELRDFSPYFKQVEDNINDSRASSIHRRGLVHDVEDPEEE